MKTITIASLKIENFKGIKTLNIDFSDKGMNIDGPNGCGKSTIADAISWVLFGKNTAGQEAEKKGGFALKTIAADGQVIPRIDHSVEITLLVDGVKVKLDRILQEDWIKRRGNAEEEFKGHTVTYKINDRPVKAAEYADKVTEICDESKFQLLTRPDYFFSLKWQDQRDLLIGMVGVPSAADAAAASNLMDVLTLIGDESIIDFKTRKSYELKKLKPELEACPSKIEGIRKVMPQEVHNASQIDEMLNAKQAELTELRNKMAELNTPTAADAIKQQLADQEAALNALNAERQAHIELEKAKYDKEIADIEAKKKAMADKVLKAMDAVTFNTALSRSKGEQIEKLTAHMQDLRDQWVAVNSRKMVSAEGNAVICPLTQLACSSAEMSESMAIKAAQGFENEKNAEKKAIEAKAAAVKEDLDAHKITKEIADQSIISAQNELESIEADAKTFTAEVENMIKAAEMRWEKNIDAIDRNSSQAIAAMEKAIVDSELKLNLANGDVIDTTALDALNSQICLIEGEISALNVERGQLSQIRNCEAQIGLILTQERNLGEQIAVIEREIFQAETLHHAQMDELERRVNELFGGKLAVKLFDQQINGGEAETCQILKDGVRYNDLNTAGRVHAGLSLIAAVQQNLQTLAPVIIDNAESVIEWPTMANQMIYLSVSSAVKELTINEL